MYIRVCLNGSAWKLDVLTAMVQVVRPGHGATAERHDRRPAARRVAPEEHQDGDQEVGHHPRVTEEGVRSRNPQHARLYDQCGRA